MLINFEGENCDLQCEMCKTHIEIFDSYNIINEITMCEDCIDKYN